MKFEDARVYEITINKPAFGAFTNIYPKYRLNGTDRLRTPCPVHHQGFSRSGTNWALQIFYSETWPVLAKGGSLNNRDFDAFLFAYES